MLNGEFDHKIPPRWMPSKNRTRNLKRNSFACKSLEENGLGGGWFGTSKQLCRIAKQSSDAWIEHVLPPRSSHYISALCEPKGQSIFKEIETYDFSPQRSHSAGFSFRISSILRARHPQFPTALARQTDGLGFARIAEYCRWLGIGSHCQPGGMGFPRSTIKPWRVDPSPVCGNGVASSAI